MRLSTRTPKTIRRSRKMPKLFTLMVLAAALATFLIPAAFGADAGSNEAETDWDLIWSFVQAVDAVSANLAEIDQALLDASLALSDAGIEGQEARKVLDDLTDVGPWVVDCITVDLNGTIVEVRPAEYQQVVGTSIRDQEHIERLFFTRRPVGLAYINSVEGFRAMDFASPIFDDGGRFAGAVTVLVNSTELFGQALAPYQPDGRAKIWVMMPDGTIIYDSDAEQIGRNTFSDPLFQQFPNLLAVGERVEMERSGHGTYEIFGTERDVFWTTADYQGEEIRLLLSVDV
jgi:hypothetical protein